LMIKTKVFDKFFFVSVQVSFFRIIFRRMGWWWNEARCKKQKGIFY
jgi:hypothetical protein